jgi:hypothetical protein
MIHFSRHVPEKPKNQRKAGLGPVLVTCLALAACDYKPKLSTQPALLAGPGASPVSMTGPSCSSCHTYPLHDVNHNYHLMSANVNRNNLGQPELNAVTTCLDCHFNSIRHFAYTHTDTTWMDSNGIELTGHTSPSDKVMKVDAYPRWRPVPYGIADTARGEALATEIDSLIFRRARVGEMVEWMTSWTHNDGVVDVEFAPNNVTQPEFLKTAYRPKDLSCSAMTCHNSRDRGYRWMSLRQGLSNCPSLDGHDPTCPGEVAAPAPKETAE